MNLRNLFLKRIKEFLLKKNKFSIEEIDSYSKKIEYNIFISTKSKKKYYKKFYYNDVLFGRLVNFLLLLVKSKERKI